MSVCSFSAIICIKNIRYYKCTSLFYSTFKSNAPVFNCKSKFLNLISFKKNQVSFESNRKIMNLSSVIEVFEKHVPKYLAETWDNTGLLIEPEKEMTVTRILFTNDLTEDVLEEALKIKANLIISYHPPIFKPMKVFLCKNWKDRIAMKCIANCIAVYSPHTACDAVKGGVNDWLIKGFNLKDLKPIIPSADFLYCVLECLVESDTSVMKTLSSHLDFKVILRKPYEDKLWLKVLFSKQSKDVVIPFLSMYPEIQVLTIQDCTHPKHAALTGMGRVGKLQKPMKLGDCINLMKKHVDLDRLRVTIGVNKYIESEMSTIAACAGSGSSVLNNVPADLYITGEMSHHDLLDAHQKGISVILCEHSNSERGYLKLLADQLRSDLIGVHLVVSSVDRDPVTII